MKIHKLIFAGTLSLCISEAVSAQTSTYRIMTDRPEQPIMHFGASDAWSMKYVGLWPKQQQEQIADWLFSTKNDANGQPRGMDYLSGASILAQEVRNKVTVHTSIHRHGRSVSYVLTVLMTGPSNRDNATFSS